MSDCRMEDTRPNQVLPLPVFSYKDLLLKKLSYAVTCSVLSQLVILQLYVFFTNLNLFHPSDWIKATFSTFASFTAWLFIIPFLTIIVAQSVICAKDYVIKSTYCSTRFQKFISVFSLRNFVLLILHMTIGSLLIWLFLSLRGGQYQHLIVKCKGENHCLNKSTYYLIVSGLWTGFYFFIKVYISEKHLSFPVIHQRKILQLKTEISTLIKGSVTSSFWPVLYYIVLYYLQGENLSNGFSDTFGLFSQEENDSIRIYFYLWFFSALYYFNMNLMRTFFNMFLTEPVEYPLVKSLPESLTLQESINNNNWPIIQNLACLDLCRLSQWSQIRRRVFFTLSQPGGHPHNWNSLTENILKLFTEYKDLLNKSTDVSKKPANPNPVTNVQTPLHYPDRFRNLRNMTLVTPEEYNLVNVSQNLIQGINVPETLISKFSQKLESIWNMIKIISGINFLFGELPQANIQKCLANGHLIIWASQGISSIVCASIIEDPYGVVQKDLPVIITCLVSLKQSLDKLNKVPLTRKMVGYDDFNYKMKAAVTTAVKRSLFNICRTFGVYLDDIPLSKEVLQYLQIQIVCKS